MGSTPRERLTQLPMPTRSTEASTDCFGRIVLSYLREDEQAQASYFVLGDLLHRGIEEAIKNDRDLHDMTHIWFDMEMEKVEANHNPDVPQLETSRRGWETLVDDYQRMMKQWFTKVHPDSDKRHPIYDDYQWPPRTEVEFHRTARSAGTKYAIWGSVDALFEHKEISPPRLIIDWKSAVDKIKSDFQLHFYRFGTGMPGSPAAYHRLDKVQDRAIIQEAEPYPGDDEVRAAIDLTERRKDAVLAGRMPRFVPSPLCNYCPVQHLCPADGDVRNRQGNMTYLQDMLQSVEAMETIPSTKGVDIGRVRS